MKNENIIEVRKLYKKFGETIAINNVDFAVKKGEMLNLVGENGAGKTTLIKLIGGQYQPDKGDIIYKGSKVKWDNPYQALSKGIGIIHQHPLLINEFTAAENIFLGKEITKNNILKENKLYQKAEKLLEEYPVTSNFNLRKKAADMSAGEKHIVEILKILSYDIDVLLLDEPTASLPKNEVELLLDLISYLNEEKHITIIYISHKLEEGLEICNKTMVLRNGEKVGFLNKDEFNKDRIINLMIDYDLSEFYPDKAQETGNKILQINDLNTSNLNNISLDLNKGEIVGLYGLMGAGMEEVLEAIFGLEEITGGNMILKNAQISNPQTKKMIDSGVYYIPGDRHSLGLFPAFSVQENMTIAHLYDLFKGKLMLPQQKEKKIVEEKAGELKIKCSGVNQNIKELSGGNQQKVVVGRWLLNECEVLLLNKPTMGIDVGAKRDIYNVLRNLTKAGKGILFVSGDMDEVIGICDRIYTMREGEITKKLDSEEISKETILKYIL